MPVRLVQFGDIDLCACCGTHVAHTGEIGLIKLFSTTHFRGGSRIEMACGGRALAVLNALCAQNRDISVRLSANAVQTACPPWRDWPPSGRRRSSAPPRWRTACLPCWHQDGQTLRFERQCPPRALRPCWRMPPWIRAKRSALRRVCRAGRRRGTMPWPTGTATCGGLTKRLNAALQGRGGGKPGFVQGSLAASRTDIEAFFTAESCSTPDQA